MVVKGKLTYFRLCLYSVVSSRCHRCSGVGGTKVTGWRLLSDLGNANKIKKGRQWTKEARKGPGGRQIRVWRDL